MIALVLKDGFLPKFDSVLLLELLDERLEELLLGLHLFHLCLHLSSDPLLHAPLVHFIATDLCKEFHMSHRSKQ